MKRLKVVLKNLLPPYFTQFARYCRSAIRSLSHTDEKIGFKYGFENYSQSEIYLRSIGFDGYQEEEFIEKLTAAARNVRDGIFAYERDTVVFNSTQYSWPLVAALLLAADQKNSISVLDYGGGLGTTYRQNRRFLASKSIKISWKILEQEALVKIGREEFLNDELDFINELGELKEVPKLVIFGGSICYLPYPYDVMKEIFNLGPEFIVLDRTPFVSGRDDLFAVQFVPPTIYKAALPIVSLSEEKFNIFMKTEYELIANWTCDMQPDLNSTAMGFLWKKKLKYSPNLTKPFE
jgi:putative methyltransferase (TIGR04325 family)